MKHLKTWWASLENTKNPDDIKRQAVVIIHGIGEQRPMDTLRRFVEAVLYKENQNTDENTLPPYYSKPDTISDSYELRRIKLKKLTGINEDWYNTDFFEYYLAHHMSGTEWWHVLSWIWRILHRSLSDLREIFHRHLSDVTEKDCEKQKRIANEYHRNHERNHMRLGLLYALTFAFIIAAIVVVLTFVIFTMSRPVVAITGAPAILLALIACFKFLPRLFLRKAKNTIGDAARYLDIAPANIARRYDILRGGKDVLRSLHDRKSPFTEEGTVRSYSHRRAQP